MMGCAVFKGTRRFCGSCGFNRGIHRRWRVLDGGKEEIMAATSEMGESSANEHRQAATTIGEALQLSGPGALVYMTVPDYEKWEALKELAGAPVRLSQLGGWENVCETIELHRGDMTLKAHGPLRPATMADLVRLRAQERG